MSWHLFGSEEIECTSCKTRFFPLEPEHECPRCGLTTTAHSDFLSEFICGLRIHRAEYGSFTPGGYFVGSLAENLFYWACQILDAAEESVGSGNMEDAIRSTLDSIDWADQGFMRGYFQKLLICAWRQLE